MLHVVILTLALASGECPDCQRSGGAAFANPNRPGLTGAPTAPALVPPPTIIKHPSVIHTIPRPIVGCVGQNCFSCTRPFLPGVPVFNYRQDFNYPWSQVPCALPPAAAMGPAYGEPEEVPAPLMESRRPAPSKVKITASRTGVHVTDQVQAATRRR